MRITRAVWSLWTKPRGRRWSFGWESELHHLCAWVLSFETAKRHFDTTALVTDSTGADWLIDRLGLQFDEVSTTLDALDDANPDWWALGKLHTYAMQREPFVHIDSDVFLWKPLPGRLLEAKMLAQNLEVRGKDDPAYRVADFIWAIRQAGGCLPHELEWYHLNHPEKYEVACCGILGGTDFEALCHYAKLAIGMMQAPTNQPAWCYMGDQTFVSLIFEQYLLSACLAHGKVSPDSPFRNATIEYLFDSEADAFRDAHTVGYTHLISGAKRNRETLIRLEQRVRQEYPKYFKRCLTQSCEIEDGRMGTERPRIDRGRAVAKG